MPADGFARIEIRLRELAQLFNSMDPSPFIDRDLDDDAERFIVSWARELPTEQEFELVLHLATAPHSDRSAGVEAAVQHYFANRAEMKRREFRLLLRHGRLSLLVGLSFLTLCLLLGQAVQSLGPTTINTVVKESLAIGGWVAMWRPLQIYLYDWWPLREELRVLERLGRMRVQVEVPAA
ncbi:MAG: hypothetical protein HZA31_13540 [Opitutae bacterium]|nr:hypothetical protein [Opitutae bacterium]